MNWAFGQGHWRLSIRQGEFQNILLGNVFLLVFGALVNSIAVTLPYHAFLTEKLGAFQVNNLSTASVVTLSHIALFNF